MCSSESISCMSKSIAKTSKNWRIKVVAFRVAVTVVSVRHGTLKLTKKLLVGAQTLKIENSVALACSSVDMNMITQLHFDYAVALRLRLRDIQTLLQSTVVYSCAC